MMHARERGMTIIEVVVAVVIIAIVVSSLALAVDGGNRLRGAARLQASMTVAGEKVQEQLSSDRRWMRSCSDLGRACDLTDAIDPDSLALEDVRGDAVIRTAEATPEDSELDGLLSAGNDLDGVTPDYYRLVIVLEPTRELASRYGVRPSASRRRFVTSIDRNGERMVGSLVVEACKVVNQADERMQVQGCANARRTHIDMRGCPSAGARAGCTEAWSWIAGIRSGSNTSPPGRSPFLSLERVSTRGWGIGIVDASSPGARRITPDRYEDGKAVFENVPAGEYRLVGVPNSSGARTERWTTHELPSHHDGRAASVVVDAGIQNRALVMFRPTRAGSINLFFQRKIRTYHLGGPYWTHQVHIPPNDEPTDGYQSGSAAETCAEVTRIWGEGTLSSAGGWHECVDVVPHGQNCADVLVSGDVWTQVPLSEATHILMHELGAINSAVPIGDLEDPASWGDPVKMVHPRREVAVRYCTYYAELFDHKYYSTTDPTPPFVTVDGARHAVTYYSEPKPDYRHIDFLGGGRAESPIPVCVTRRYGQCTTPSWPGVVPLSSGLVPGLSSDVMNPPADAADARVNDYFTRYWPTRQPLASGAIWTRTDGTMETPAGRYSGRRVTIIGMGECYWTSVRFSGRVEGPCDPCKPMWSRTRYYEGCSLLVKTRWCRPAWETVQNFNWPTGGGPMDAPFKYAIETKCGTIDYSPPWSCTTTVPRTGNGSTCHPQPTGGGGDERIPTTRHRSGTSHGAGVQGTLSMGSGRT